MRKSIKIASLIIPIVAVGIIATIFLVILLLPQP